MPDHAPSQSRGTGRSLMRPGPLAALAVAVAGAVFLYFTWQNNQATPETIAADYQAAIANWEERGEVARNEVRDRMKPLASLEPEALSHAGAHLWIANDLLGTAARVSAEASREPTQQAIQHLERAVALDPMSEDAHRSLGQLYLRSGDIEKTILFLSDAVERMPGLAVLLAWVHDNQGHTESAREPAALGAKHWAAVVATAPEDVQSRLKWARAEMLLDHDDKVLEILEAGREQAPTDGRFDSFEMGLRQRQANRLLAADPPQAGEAIAILEQAVLLRPQNGRLIGQFSTIGKDHPDTRPRVRETLDRLLAAGAPALNVHIALGTLAMEDAEFETALTHFERAHAITPGNVAVVSNLARCLIEIDPPQRDRAQGLIEGAMKTNPRAANNPLLLETRGALLIGQGNHQEGVTDLEKALPSLITQPGRLAKARSLLAEAHRALGNPDKAAEYEKEGPLSITLPNGTVITTPEAGAGAEPAPLPEPSGSSRSRDRGDPEKEAPKIPLPLPTRRDTEQ